MSQALLNEASIRIKRWAEAACNAGLVKGGAKPEIRTSALWPLGQRWRVYERMKWSLDGTADGPVIDSECCVAAAPTVGELLHKYTLWAQDENRQGYFRERHLRGESQYRPPPDPPEWAERRAALAATVDRANENATEWVKRAVRTQMQHIGMDDPVKFELAWQRAKAMGAVKAR